MSDHVHDCPTCGGYFECEDCDDPAPDTRECLECQLKAAALSLQVMTLDRDDCLRSLMESRKAARAETPEALRLERDSLLLKLAIAEKDRDDWRNEMSKGRVALHECKKTKKNLRVGLRKARADLREEKANTEHLAECLNRAGPSVGAG